MKSTLQRYQASKTSHNCVPYDPEMCLSMAGYMYMFSICMLLKPLQCLFKRGVCLQQVICLVFVCCYTLCTSQQWQLIRGSSVYGRLWSVFVLQHLYAAATITGVCLWQVTQCAYRHLYIAATITMPIYESACLKLVSLCCILQVTIMN